MQAIVLGPIIVAGQWRCRGRGAMLTLHKCNLTGYALLEKQSVPDWSAMAEDFCPFQAASAVEDSDSEAMLARNSLV